MIIEKRQIKALDERYIHLPSLESIKEKIEGNKNLYWQY